jgi:hypothetical protein
MTLARMYAQAVLCEQDLNERVDAAPCGVCHECVAMQGSGFAYVEKDARGDSEAMRTAMNANWTKCRVMFFTR